MPDIEEDLKALVELVHEIAKKHGNPYITIFHCAGSEKLTCGKYDLGYGMKDVDYWEEVAT